ncbi:MAG: hypothetical protein ABIX37_05235 [Gammaproteobacteria bacterium]
MSRLWLTLFLTLSVALSTAVTGCSPGAKQGAGHGAKAGAVGGLVAGAVGSIFWGGGAVNNALRAGAVGAASGAAVGAMNGAERDKRQSAPSAPPTAGSATGGLSAADRELKAKMGDLNFAAGEELAHCRHVSAISRAEKAYASETDPKRRSYALLIQAMAAEESGNARKASAVYSQWGQFDPARADAAKTRNEALDGLLKLQKIRQDNGLPPLCT